MYMKPLVSIVTVTFNAIDVIFNTIDSVKNQNYNSFEFIVIDGGSTDGTLDVIRNFSTYITYSVSQPDKGIYDAMNKAIDVATGEWLIFMNAGDCFVNNEVLNDLFNQEIDDDVSVIYGNTIVKYPRMEVLLPGKFFTKNDINLPFCHQSSLVKTSLLKEIRFDLCYKIAADYNFYYTLFKTGKSFKYVDISIAKYDAIGFSTNRVLETFVEVCQSNGNNSGWKFRIKCCYFNIRKLIMNCIPQILVEYYRRAKYAS